MLRLHVWFLGVLLVTVPVMVACSGGGEVKASSEQVKVSMKEMAYSPKELRVKAGTTVVWVNDDVIDHSVTTSSGSSVSFASKDFGSGKTFSYTFSKKGTYPLHCSTPGHEAAGMKMTVIVE